MRPDRARENGVDGRRQLPSKEGKELIVGNERGKENLGREEGWKKRERGPGLDCPYGKRE